MKTPFKFKFIWWVLNIFRTETKVLSVKNILLLIFITCLLKINHISQAADGIYRFFKDKMIHEI